MIFIKYREVELKCEFKMDAYEEATMYQPEEGGEIYDVKVYIQDVEVTEMLEESQIDDIKLLISDKL